MFRTNKSFLHFPGQFAETDDNDHWAFVRESFAVLKICLTFTLFLFANAL
jgi:hypothetical protein